MELALFITIGVLFAYAVSYECTETFRVKRSRRTRALIVCIVTVVLFSVLWGYIVALSVEPGDEIGGQIAATFRPAFSPSARDALIVNTFLVLIIPALIGVWQAVEPDDDLPL